MADTGWTTEDVRYLPLEKCTERNCGPRVRYNELTDDANTHWHRTSGSVANLTAHDAEVAAKALEDAADDYTDYGYGNEAMVARTWLRARAAALRGGGQ